MRPPLRVSFVADTESWGGAEVWLVHHLRRAAAHGIVASVVCAAPVADRLRRWVPPHRLEVVPLARHAGSAPGTAVALHRQEPDLVHVNLVDPGSHAATLSAALAAAPTTATLHLPGDTGLPAHRRLLGSLYGRLELLISASEEGARQVRGQLVVPRLGVTVATNGVDIPSHPHGPAGRHPAVVGAFGRLTSQKGFDLLLEACRFLREGGRCFQVVIAGAGREEEALRAAAAGLPVTFAGWVSDQRRFLSGLDVFCLPSRHEALPLALLEAMAEGLPCVATDVGDIRRTVGRSVRIVPPQDPEALAAAIAGLLDDPAGAARLGRQARSCAEQRLDAEEMVARTYRLLRAVAPHLTRRTSAAPPSGTAAGARPCRTGSRVPRRAGGRG